MTRLVSVWIPSYNHAPYLAHAIESVLGQTLEDVELTIVDDGSADGSLEIAQRYAAAHSDRVTVLTHPGHENLGLVATGNLARSRSSGRYLLGLGSDDVLYPDALEREVAFLEGHPRVGLVYGYAHLIDALGRRLPFARTFGIDVTRGVPTVERLVQGNTIPAMTVMFRRECLQQVGEEDDGLVYADWEFHTRAAAHWEVGFIPRALAMYRSHGANTGLNASREANVARALDVTAAMRTNALSVGGGLAEPRVRATLELQMGFLRFASGDMAGAAADVRAAFQRDPSLAFDGVWLGDWLWSRLLDELLPGGGPEFVPWFERTVLLSLEGRAARTLRREAAAARGAARAINLARAGRPTRAQRAALGALVRSPRRVADRRLAAVLLESAAGGVPAKGLRIAKRRLLPRR
jgi:alpha-1,3-rhamnosyltransferase